jgi:glycosyltransferase involved in cell wall biosynthesis
MMDLFDAIDSDSRFDLRVLFLERSAVAAPGVYWKERSLPRYCEVLPGRWFSFSRARVHVNSGFRSALCRYRPDLAIVMGYSELTNQLAMWWLRAKRIPWIFWGELPGIERRGPLGRLGRWVAQRPIAWLATGVAGMGSRAADAYGKMVGDRCPIWNIPYYCDNWPFLSIPRLWQNDEKPHFLYCGQMVARKGVDLLIKCFCRLAADHRNVRLTMVGDGPLRRPLMESVPLSMRDRVDWPGFKQVDQLPSYFAQANVFVLPSVHDGWGVVINQALSAGMPVIASHGVGAAADLVSDQANGIIVPAKDEAALTEAMRFFAENPANILAYGRSSRERASVLGPNYGVELWYQFCRTVLGRTRARQDDNVK